MTKVLVLTSLFPNKIKPDLGVFIKKRMVAYSQREGCEIQVVAPVPYYPDFKFLRRYQYYTRVPLYEVIDGIKVYHPRYPMIPKVSMRFHGRLMYFGIKNFIKKRYKEFAFDLIDAHFIYPDCQAGVFLGDLLNIPVVVSARGSDIHQYVYYSGIKPQIIDTLKRSAHIISVCNALKDMMLDIDIDEKKISVIPNGIDDNHFYILDKTKARQEMGIEIDKYVLLSVGALIPLKGHDFTIRAVAHLINTNPNLRLYIIGSGPEESRLKSLVETLELQKVVFFVGQVPNNDLIAWYNAADLFCLSSEREGWPNVLTESLSCGTPVVATKVFGTPEIVKNDSMGILVERNCEDISKGIAQALLKNWDKSVISEEISKRTWEVVADECSRVFCNAIENKSKTNE